MLGNAARHVPQFFADSGRVHVEDDAGMLAFRLGRPTNVDILPCFVVTVISLSNILGLPL
jgi:hypothetical protein